ncbi:MAG: hypothetical protein GXY05_08060 [Clostridiales bacterium]|nr:hypothetical protein [Clostridiales bacterium]
MIVLVIGIFLLLALSDFPKLIKEKKWYVVSVLSGFYVFTIVLAVLYTAGVTLPSPIKGIQYLIVDVLHLGLQKQ